MNKMNKNEIIEMISDESFRRKRDLISKFLDKNNLQGLWQATSKQLIKFCKEEKIRGVR